jgi:hypothetical protein
MQDTVRCPSCQVILVLPPVPPEGDFVCPRCQALVPLTRPTPELSSAGRSAAVTDASRPSGGQAVWPGEAPDRHARPIRAGKDISRAASIVIGILIGVCVAAIAALRHGSWGPLDRGLHLTNLFALLLVLVLVELIIWLRWLCFPRGQREVNPVVGAGCFLVAWGLLSVAAAIFLVKTCSAFL